MKPLKTIFWLVLCLASIGPSWAGDPINETLQKGLFEEEANHNLDAAIKAYQDVINLDSDQRKMVATAVFRLGECYRKQGKNNEARAQYERIARDYADQPVLLQLSRQLINSMAPASAVAVNAPSAAPATNVEADEVQRIKALIKDSPDLVNVPDNNGLAPLGQAASKGYLVVAQFLLANSADIEQKDRQDNTPLHLAATGGHKAMVELLLAHHANVNARNNNGVTPLHIAARKGFKAVAQVLLANKAEVNSRVRLSNNAGDNDSTPLHYAAGNGLKALVEFLLANGADVNAVNGGGGTPLLWAVSGGHLAVVELLLSKQANVNLYSGQGLPPLLRAVESSRADIAQLLLDHGADVQATGCLNQLQKVTPLHVAVFKGDKTMVELLLHYQADVNASDAFGARPLLYAVYAGQTALAELLLAKNAEVNFKASKIDGNQGSFSDIPPLQLAVFRRSKETVALLLRYKAEVNVTDSDKRTPLHRAAGDRQKDIVQLLVDHQADVNALDKSGNSPLNCTQWGPPGGPDREVLLQIAQILRDHGASEDIQRRAYITASRKAKNYTERLFEKDANGFNHFTLFEAIAQIYAPGRGGPNNFSFPDLTQVKINRLNPKPGVAKEVSVNLDLAFNTGDMAKNLALEWGDLVEIPEQDHMINEPWPGLSAQATETLDKFLRRNVSIVVKGQTNSLTLIQSLPAGHRTMASGTVMTMTLAQPVGLVPAPKTELFTFWLYPVVTGANVLRASSDVTRVKVQRLDGAAHVVREMAFNLEKRDTHNDLWLRDGDVIEIPEKP